MFSQCKSILIDSLSAMHSAIGVQTPAQWRQPPLSEQYRLRHCSVTIVALHHERPSTLGTLRINIIRKLNVKEIIRPLTSRGVFQPIALSHDFMFYINYIRLYYQMIVLDVRVRSVTKSLLMTIIDQASKPVVTCKLIPHLLAPRAMRK